MQVNIPQITQMKSLLWVKSKSKESLGSHWLKTQPSVAFMGETELRPLEVLQEAHCGGGGGGGLFLHHWNNHDA